jgi:LysR family glycine cleavage system transcriptional activator
MQRGRLPLTALRSFEAAGRHLSFSRAAEELFVSQAAISRQVRELERFLGKSLFTRLHRKVVLTEAGARLLAQVTASFNDLDRALGEFDRPHIAESVRLTVDPAVAACWLVPRLDRFRRTHPDIDLVLEVDPRLADFSRDEADLGLRFSYQATSWPGTEVERLASAAETPMISPALLASGPPLAAPDDLRAYTLLHEETRQHWEDWFRAAGGGERPLPARRGPLLADPSLTRQAALLGHGVALGDVLLMHDTLVAGDLVMPFATRVTVGTYWLAARRMRGLSLAARAVADWIRTEIAECVPELV